uniref:AAA+ ATPase domain-containing protein n=1 Tax=Anopheles dirus TaxID=7168 RepID=A0A182N974_9DIPT
MMHRKASPFPYDPMIIPRVKQYLEDNVHQTYVDTGVMARELQQRYREYNRRKSTPFRMLVEQAYRTVLQSYGLDSNASSEVEEDAASDVELMVENAAAGSAGGANQRNQMSSTLTNMYMNNRGNRAPAAAGAPDQSGATGADGEAIDISSDEEDGDEPCTPEAGEFVAQNKHVTVTKLTRVDKARDDESSNGSVESSGGNAAAGGEKHAPESKRRRLETANASTPSVHSNANGQLSRPGAVGNKPHKTGSAQPTGTGGTTAIPTSSSATGGAGQRAKKFRKEIVSRMVSTTFDDIGGMDRILKDLCELLLHVKHPEIYRHIGLPPPRGFLLHGPPGSGKTLLAQAIAGQLKIGLIEVPATELVAGVSGESEERIRDVFEQAVALSPCVLFIDEIDAISSNRINAQKDMERRIVAQLLSSLDALGKQEGGEGVIVIGATNRADSLDPALRRVGRFDQEISLGIPDRAARTQILRIICRKLTIADSIDYGELAKLTPGYVGADLLALATRAANNAIKRLFTKQEREMLEELSTQAVDEDVVAIEDEPVAIEVVNLDDEKDDQKEAENKAASEPVANEAPTEKTVESETEENMNVAEQVVADSTQASEPTASTALAEDAKENEPVAADAVAAASTAADVAEEKMDVDADQSPTATEDVVNKEETVSKGPAEQDQPMEAEKDDNQNVSPAAVEEEKPAVAAAAVEPSSDTSAIKPVLPLLEPTLEQMLNLLLNQQKALPTEELEGLCIERDDFLESLRTVQPSAKREGFITVPDVTWNDIGSLGDIREELKLAILAPVKFPQRLRLLGLNAPSGVLLCGPPGCGKTLLAKAVANEAGINFISVKGPELLNMYVGESERAVRQCFQRARNSAPCVIFFDEFDSLCPKRSDTAEGSAGTRVVNQLLTEMDGIEERKGVFLMAATNRPDIVDPAVLRPGRLDKILYVGLPAQDDRVDILRALTKNRTQPPLAEDVEFERVAELTDGYTGADLAGLVRQASLQTLKDSIVACAVEERVGESGGLQDAGEEELCLTVRMGHFLEAIRTIKPSVNAEDKKHYEKLRLKYGVCAMA